MSIRQHTRCIMEYWQLKQRQSLPLEVKINLTKQRIREWLNEYDAYVSFSGGKDSTVLLHLARQVDKHIVAVFVNTGLEYPENVDFVKTIDNVLWLRPEKSFKDVIEKCGYPVISKSTAQYIEEARTTKSDKLREIRLHSPERYKRIPAKWLYLLNAPFKISDKCCYWLKKRPGRQYQRETQNYPIFGTTSGESATRLEQYRKYGCNRYKQKQSHPMSFWTSDDVWKYIRENNLSYSKLYDMGWERSGCMFCMFGVHLEKEPNRFQLMYNTHPKLWDYCMNKLGCGLVLDYIDVPCKPQLTLF